MKRQQNLKLISLLICVICYINIMASLVSAENIELNANPLYSNISGYDTQKNLIKNVTQWTMLPRNERTIPLIENDTEIFYSATKSIEGNPMWGVDITYYDISELPWGVCRCGSSYDRQDISA